MESANQDTFKKKRKRKWKPVTLDSSEFFQSDMTGFVSLEVLIDDDDFEVETGGKVMKKDEEDTQYDGTVGNVIYCCFGCVLKYEF